MTRSWFDQWIEDYNYIAHRDNEPFRLTESGLIWLASGKAEQEAYNDTK